MNNSIKDLMTKAIEEKRPEEIEKFCLPIWNEPFFFKIDKATVLTISYNPTDLGTRKMYPGELEKYKKDPNSISASKIYDLLYNWRENDWRRSYNWLFSQLGIADDEIAHKDVSIYPYEKLDYFNNCKCLDKSDKYLFDVVDLLSEQLKIIFIDGKKNENIVKYFIKDYELINVDSFPINGSPYSHELKIYKHKTKDLYLIYYACFMYGATCPKEDNIKEIGNHIKEVIDLH